MADKSKWKGRKWQYRSTNFQIYKVCTHLWITGIYSNFISEYSLYWFQTCTKCANSQVCMLALFQHQPRAFSRVVVYVQTKTMGKNKLQNTSDPNFWFGNTFLLTVTCKASDLLFLVPYLPITAGSRDVLTGDWFSLFWRSSMRSSGLTRGQSGWEYK